MAITELIFPALNPDDASIKEVEGLWPTISKRLTTPNPGLLNAFRGWIISENDKDVRDANREVLIFEWDEEASFYTFIASDQFAGFVDTIKHLVAGPPTLQLYNTNESPKDASSASAVEIVRLHFSDNQSIEVAQHAWQRFLMTWDGQRPKPVMMNGTSLNLDNKVLLCVLGWASLEDRSSISKQTGFTEELASLRSLGELSQITVDVSPLELPGK